MFKFSPSCLLLGNRRLSTPSTISDFHALSCCIQPSLQGSTFHILSFVVTLQIQFHSLGCGAGTHQFFHYNCPCMCASACPSLMKQSRQYFYLPLDRCGKYYLFCGTLQGSTLSVSALLFMWMHQKMVWQVRYIRQHEVRPRPQ